MWRGLCPVAGFASALTQEPGAYPRRPWTCGWEGRRGTTPPHSTSATRGGLGTRATRARRRRGTRTMGRGSRCRPCSATLPASSWTSTAKTGERRRGGTWRTKAAAAWSARIWPVVRPPHPLVSRVPPGMSRLAGDLLQSFQVHLFHIDRLTAGVAAPPARRLVAPRWPAPCAAAGWMSGRWRTCGSGAASSPPPPPRCT